MELFHSVYGGVRKVGERQRSPRWSCALLEQPEHRQGTGTILLPSVVLLQLHSPCGGPALAGMFFLYVCFLRTGIIGLHFSIFLDVSEQHL